MQCSCAFWLACTTVLYFSCTIYTVQGKCSGRWAIHACYGGNGKRSGTDTAADNTNAQRKLLLRQWLLSGSPLNGDMAAPEEEAPTPLQDVDTLYDGSDDQALSTVADLNRVRSYLASLLLEKKIREAEDDIAY